MGHTAELNFLKAALSRIAKALGLNNPEMHGQSIRNKLIRSIEHHRSNVACMRQYDEFLERSLILTKDYSLYYLIRLTQNKRTIGRRRGLLSGTTSASIDDAATIKSFDQLSPVEQLAYAFLKGTRLPKKNTQHPIERRAFALAEAVKAEWLPERVIAGRPKGKWQRKPADINKSLHSETLPLTILDVVSLATPIIENFAQCRITRKSETFDALYWFVRAHTVVIRRHTPKRPLQISQKSVYQALRRSRLKLTN